MLLGHSVPEYNRSMTKREIDHESGMVRCTRCGTWKPVTEYYANRSLWGFMPHCKSCHRTYQKDWYTKKRERELRVARDSIGPTPYDDLLKALTDVTDDDIAALLGEPTEE
jgi:hypothetical protein